jgi:hypothetical protein
VSRAGGSGLLRVHAGGGDEHGEGEKQGAQHIAWVRLG